MQITGDAANLWFLNFPTAAKEIRKLARLRRANLVGAMIRHDTMRIRELSRRIKPWQIHTAGVAGNAAIAGRLVSMPGCGAISSAEPAGETGTVRRFRGEASLALYLGMARFDNSSGNTNPVELNAVTYAPVDIRRFSTLQPALDSWPTM